MSEGDVVKLTVQNNKDDVKLSQGHGMFTRWAIIIDGAPGADKHILAVEVTDPHNHKHNTRTARSSLASRMRRLKRTALPSSHALPAHI